MADTTSKKLLRLLQSHQPMPLRLAAAQVLGEVGSRDAEHAQALCETLTDPEPALRLEVLQAIGKLRIEKALPQLLERVKEGGPESEAAAQAAAHMGAKGIKALRTLMTEVAPGLRRRIAAAMATGGTADAENAAVDALLDSDPGVVNAAARTLLSEVPTLGDSQRRALADHLLELLGPRKGGGLPQASEAALLRVLAAIGDVRGSSVFWTRAEPGHAAEVRAVALQALGTLPPPTTPKQLKVLFACASDRDFRVAAPALMILKPIPVSDRALKDWLPLFDAPDVAARRFAIEKLGDRDSPEVAQGLLRQLTHRDGGLRNEALGRLAQLEQGREALAGKLLEAESPDEAWTLARGQTSLVKHYPAVLRARLLAQACEYLEEGDRRADPLLFLLREGDPREVRDQIEERALALRKKKHYEKALTFLRLLTRDPACGEGIRFEAAACGLKVSGHDLAAEARTADAALQQFARLVHSHEVHPCERIEQARWLEPEDLFYLGFHFVEGNGPDRDFGARVLRLMIKRSPKSKLAKDARSKLRSQGLD